VAPILDGSWKSWARLPRARELFGTRAGLGGCSGRSGLATQRPAAPAGQPQSCIEQPHTAWRPPIAPRPPRGQRT
jgi:hypothetical protein